MSDHIHVSALRLPRLSPAYVANYLKGRTARRILQRFLELKTGARCGKLWSRSCFVATVSNVTSDIIKKYIEEQWDHEAYDKAICERALLVAKTIPDFVKEKISRRG